MSEMESAAAGSVPSPRLLVVGCGAIGSVVAANLANLGANLTILSRNEAIADAINARGVIVQGDSPLGRVDASVVTTLEGNERPFDAILLAVQPPQVEDAARRVVGHLAHDGVLVCLQNGLCELRLTEIAGPERVVGAIVSWGAS
ncbi:MAG: NAD(P)-binding domain-containing protein, partial [Deltaproteobacteria bacterium]|nr:NAD(P)-binding domain-containing protein [Deltaproteobacteria bacterium]